MPPKECNVNADARQGGALPWRSEGVTKKPGEVKSLWALGFASKSDFRRIRPLPNDYTNRRIITAEAWPCGVTLRLMKLAPGRTSPLRTAATGHSGSGVV